MTEDIQILPDYLGLLNETIRAYRGLDDDALGVLQAHFPNDPIRQRAIAAVRRERTEGPVE